MQPFSTAFRTLLASAKHLYPCPYRRLTRSWLNRPALAVYEGYARQTVHELLDKLATLQGQPVNTTLYAALVPFDNMGRMGFSHDFGAVRAGKENRMLYLLESLFRTVGQFGQMGWPIVLLQTLVGQRGSLAEFERLAVKMTDEREKASSFFSNNIWRPRSLCRGTWPPCF